MGVFACRSPHRPNPIGLTLAKIENIRDNVIELSGIDLIDGTPVIDLKPYISDYDQPPRKKSKTDVEEAVTLHRNVEGEKGCEAEVELSVNLEDSRDEQEEGISTEAAWLRAANDEAAKFHVHFTPVAVQGLKAAFGQLLSNVPKPETAAEMQRLIENVLREDPRSVYRKSKCREQLYFASVGGLHVTAWFDDDEKVVNVMKIVIRHDDQSTASLSASPSSSGLMDDAQV